MNYTYLSVGDNLPTVGILQKLLNRAGAKLNPDGVFGPKTLAAVRQFQRSKGLTPDGIVGKDTWPRLTEGLDLPIVDCVDVFDSFQKKNCFGRKRRKRPRKWRTRTKRKLMTSSPWGEPPLSSEGCRMGLSKLSR